MATITEIAEKIYRINVEVPGSPVTYSFFVIKDDQPTLVEKGMSRMFDESLEAVKQLIDPSTLRYVMIPHFEGDECGASIRGQIPAREVPRPPCRRQIFLGVD